ncbi:hypothetical protein BJF83_21120 [Nocardiopsis sp. CNR-923]|uniref:hypothetical protein n=1 Tax=Nocardiopsis sp. CNR-923 TaxID=1904965 RepID=UPI0009679EB5|nr:hypothetical protein [Nocardiopsis sp. CNR-923]OLT26511.1 hypothetical protein BJF83_21120 [Nocardiopsis sp. CNR-923]
MGYSIRALLRETLRALLAPARGRHSAAVRRRSTRVRRYAPLPAPERAIAQTKAPAQTPRPAPRSTPPPAPIPAGDVALVRGYYRAFEREMEHRQAEARARLGRWTAKPSTVPVRVPQPRPVPPGDLLAPVPEAVLTLDRRADRTAVAV